MNRRKAKEKTAPRKELAITAGFLAAGAVLAGLARLNAGFGQWYSTHIYPVLVNVLGRITGMLPWSVAEILLYILLLLVLVVVLAIIFAPRGPTRPHSPRFLFFGQPTAPAADARLPIRRSLLKQRTTAPARRICLP